MNTGKDPNVYEVDATCPPLIAMDPISVKNRYGKNSTLKANVPKLPANAEASNSFSGNTYAVILSGGISPVSNNERYWNDCSFIYQTLRNRYNVPKANIKVIMADGTDPAADMNPEDGGAFISSPLDLDGDGAADIEYAATKENVKNVLESVSAKMTDKDHLFLYVIDHGGYDYTKEQSYVCLWNGERLYPDELNGYLSHGDAGYVSVLMGQCHSGGFAEPLKANNRIVMTACSESEKSYACEEIPFDEFVYHWTSAINGRDAFGNEVVAEIDTLPNGQPKPVSLVKAYNYACTADMYTGGKFQFASESPMLSILEKSTAEDLSMDSIPPTVYLCMSRGTTPTQAIISGTHIIRPPYYFDPYNFWNSDDIWLRNQKDGLVNQQHETPHVTEDSPFMYLYAKILNRGVKTYPGAGWKLGSWWSKSAYIINKGMWMGAYGIGGDLYGGEFGSDDVRATLAPGDTAIVYVRHIFDNDKLAEAMKEDFNICVLANVYKKSNNVDFSKDDNYWILSAWGGDRLAQKNRIDMTFRPGTSVLLPNPGLAYMEMRLEMKCSGKEPVMENRIRTRVNIPSGLLQSCVENGLEVSGARLEYSSGTVTLSSDSAVLNNVILKPGQIEKIGFRYNAIASEAITEPQTYDVDVAVYDNSTGKCIGGETFRITVNPRPAITPTVEKTYNPDGTYTLTASNVDETASYKWYNRYGTLIGTGPTITVPANSFNSQYTVEVEAESDKAISSATAKVERLELIKNVESGLDADVHVAFNVPARKNMSVTLSSASGNTGACCFPIQEGETRCVFSAPSLPKGVCRIVVSENGIDTESCKFINK